MDRRLTLGLGVGGGLLALLGLRALTRPRPPKPGDPCYPKQLQGACNSGRRKSDPIWIVIHSTEGGPTAVGTAGEFTAPGSVTSSHLAAGDDGAFQYLPDEMIACAAPGANPEGLHLELAGQASWTRAQWLAHPQTLRCASLFVGLWSARWGIPLKFLDASALKRGERGVTTHYEVNQAFHLGTHWDPGPGFPMDVLLASA